MVESQCYVCKRTEDEVKKFLTLNLQQNAKRYGVNYSDINLDQQLKSIQDVKHHKISRNIISGDRFLPHIANKLDKSERPVIFNNDSLSIEVCAICYSLVWHKTGGKLDEKMS